MKRVAPLVLVGAVVLAVVFATSGDHASTSVPDESLQRIVDQTCRACHNDGLRTANLSLDPFKVTAPEAHPEIAEKMIRKLRAGMMPPPGIPRPGPDTMMAFVTALEDRLDRATADAPNPGRRVFQRLNRVEYANSIRDLLGLEIDAGAYLPLDTKSANFDNIADVQVLSPTLLEAYLTAAGEISRLAVGDPDATPSEATYSVPRYASQRDRVEGAPFGTRGGLSVVHTFPADGEYTFRIAFQHESTGNFFGQTAPFDEQLEISINGERRALIDVDRWMHVSDPAGVNVQTGPIFIPAGPQRVSVAFLKDFEGPVEDLVSPHAWSLADKKIGYSYGITSLAHVQNVAIGGPYNATGVSDTPTRRRIFTCRPTAPDEAEPCARRIFAQLAERAYRRPATDEDVDALMTFYAEGEADGGFEGGVRMGLQALLASPDFVFRFERGSDANAGETYRIGDMALASRLSFFLWGGPPDAELFEVARSGDLASDRVLEAQIDRMLADPRAEALGSRFAGQWLRLQDLQKVHPDALMYPDFYQQLADDMVRETEMFFNYLVREDRPLEELISADYTFVNERLAEHYGMEGITGDHFRRVTYPDDTRRGLLGHGSVLTLTSHANRTSPVLRGKWVMEVLFGTPPPPPPPGVPDLEATEGAKDGVFLTTRERMEIHRANAVCRSCHQFMDPIGLALDNFDVTGQWRIRENGMPLDTRGQLYDGTPLETPGDLRQAMLARPIPWVRTFTENLMAYALGRRVEYYDMPTVRAITRDAEEHRNRMSYFIKGVVMSDAFRMALEPVETPGGVQAGDGGEGQ